MSIRSWFSDPVRQKRIFMAYCIVLLVLWGATVFGSGRWALAERGRADFTAFYTAGRIIAQGDASDLYDLEYQGIVQREILAPFGFAFPGGLLTYNYPPFFALAFAPLARLDLTSAFRLWSLINVLLLGVSVRLLTHLYAPILPYAFWSGLLIAATFVPIMRALTLGQSTMVALLAYAGFAWALTRRRDAIAGLSLALALVKPQFLLLPVLWLLFRRRWTALGGFAAGGAALLLVSCALVGAQGLRSFLDVLLLTPGSEGAYGVNPAIMPNIRGSVPRLANLLSAETGLSVALDALAAITLILTGIVLYLVWRGCASAPAAGPVSLGLQLTLVIGAGLLVSPHLNPHDLSLLVVSGAAALGALTLAAREGEGRFLIGVGHVSGLLWIILPTAALAAQSSALVLLAGVLFLVRRLALNDRIAAQDGRVAP
jgi:hypothetical protein